MSGFRYGIKIQKTSIHHCKKFLPGGLGKNVNDILDCIIRPAIALAHCVRNDPFLCNQCICVFADNGYQISINKQFRNFDQNYLIIHEADTSAEYYGSRVHPDIEEK